MHLAWSVSGPKRVPSFPTAELASKFPAAISAATVLLSQPAPGSSPQLPGHAVASSQRVGARSGQRAPTKAPHPVLEPMHCRCVFCFCADTLGLRKVLMSPLRSTPKRTKSLGTKGLPMCHTRTHHHIATSSGCGVRSHSTFHGSESPNPSRNSCWNSSIHCLAFQQTNLGISLVRQAVPPLCSQHCAWNAGPRLMFPIGILFQKLASLSVTSDSRCHLERRSAQPSPGSPASVSKPSVSRL